MAKTWHDIWAAKQLEDDFDFGSANERNVLAKLLFCNGFNSTTGSFNLNSYENFIAKIFSKANLESTSSLYEVGCGAGAFLYALNTLKTALNAKSKDTDSALSFALANYGGGGNMCKSLDKTKTLSNTLESNFNAYLEDSNLVLKNLNETKQHFASIAGNANNIDNADLILKMQDSQKLKDYDNSKKVGTKKCEDAKETTHNNSSVIDFFNIDSKNQKNNLQKNHHKNYQEGNQENYNKASLTPKPTQATHHIHSKMSNESTLESKHSKIQHGFALLGGIDYSHSLVSIAKRALPYANITQGEAINIDSMKYDCVCSFSAFHYFPSLEYAREVATKMIAKAKKCVLFLDILDLDTKEADIAYKKRLCGDAEYERLYSGKTSHLYYPRDMFVDIARNSGYAIKIEQQDIEEYDNSPYRFNAIFYKE